MRQQAVVSLRPSDGCIAKAWMLQMFAAKSCSTVWTMSVSPYSCSLGNKGAPLPAVQHHLLMQARRTFCTFHGLLRWCRRAVSDPSLGIH